MKCQRKIYSTPYYILQTLLLAAVILTGCSSRDDEDSAGTDENTSGQVTPQETGTGGTSSYAGCEVPTRFIEGSEQIANGETVLLNPDSDWALDCDSQMSAFDETYGSPESRSFLDHFHTPGNYSGITYFNYECALLSVGFTENFDTVECELQLTGLVEDRPDTGQTAVPELENAGLYNRTAIATDPKAAPDCASQIDAFINTYGAPEFTNYPEESLTELNYQCVLRVIWFDEATAGICEISGSNVTPEQWGLNPYELIEGC